jgi:Flp pilus assembly protein TadD
MVHFILGVCCERTGRISQAESSYRRALELEPRHWTAANNLAWILAWHREKPAFALRFALDAKKLQPDNPNVADTLAWIHIAQGNYSDALALLVEHESALEKDVSYQFHRAKAHQGSGQKQLADAWLRRAESGIDDYAQADERLRQGIRELRGLID